MNSKAFIFLSLLLAAFLLISSTVSAETSLDEKNEKEINSVDDAKYRCKYGCCGGSGRYGCMKCCSKPTDVHATETEPKRVEAAAAEVDQVAETSTQGGGGYGGGRKQGEMLLRLSLNMLVQKYQLFFPSKYKYS
eukprot:XP_019078910.1 PREDICTED: glycine-rich protein [Vitis vinifera]